MKKACSAMTLGAAVALALAACGTPPAQRPTRNLEGAKNFTACMLSDEGGFDDHSFNESGKKGLDRAGKELGVKTIAVQSESSADYATNIYALIQQNCKLVIGVGF
ncbi:BMP family ABC transporter substrate-binding protein, partial [uncultured Actinomyces sp.]